MIYIELLFAFIQIGLFSIGGGYAALPLIEKQAVDIHSWLTAEGFSDIMTISEMTPGPITINSATFVGMQVAGVPGAICATLGAIIPSSIIVTLLAYLYYRYKGLKALECVLSSLRPAVVAMIATAAITLSRTALFATGSLSIFNLVLLAISLVLLKAFHLSPITVIALSGGIGIITALV